MKFETIDGVELMIPQNETDLAQLIKPIAESNDTKLTDDMVIQGNADKTYGELKQFCILSDWNVAILREEFDRANDISTIYLQKIDIPKLLAKGISTDGLWIEGANEVSLEPQGIRFWFD